MIEPHPFSPSQSVAATRNELKRRVAQLFFGVGLGLALFVSGVYALLPNPASPFLAHVTASFCAVLAAVFGVGLALRDDAMVQRWLLLASAGVVLAVTLGALASGDGLHTLSLGFLGMLIGAGTVFAGMRAGAALTAASGVAVLVLALHGTRGGVHAAHIGLTPGGSPVLLNTVTLGLILVASFAAGALVLRLLNRALVEAEERERRFVNLLGIGADWYWELDENLRFRPTLKELTPKADGLLDTLIGQRPWDLEEDAPAHTAAALGQLHDLQRVLEAHQPLTDMPLQRHDGRGGVRFHRISGRPQHDAQGRLTGYWGIGRDETDTVHARLAGSASESRYKELFTRSPSPLILHRRGIVIDANDAAAGLFGFPSAAAMTGVDLLSRAVPGFHRERTQQRIAQLESMPLGSALEVTDFELQALDGARLSVQATGVRVNSHDGPASMSIYFDITARVAAESALRRSEGMLSHLFANSPDFITMSELHSGRYVMVNPAFCRIFGYTAPEIVGRTAAELGIWLDPDERLRVIDQLMTDGVVHDRQIWLRTKSGTALSLMMSAGRLRMDGRDYMVVNGRDVTETQRAQLEHAAILRSASLGIALVRDGRFIRTNPSFDTMFGAEAGTLVHEPVTGVVADADAFVRTLQEREPQLAAGGPLEMECLMRRREGSRFWCRLLVQLVDPSQPRLGGTLWIAEDVTERRRVDQALADARDAAEAASRAKSAFLANTSHEIRTPLNGLLGLARLAMQPGLDATRRDHYLDQIHDSARSLADIISDILDLSKIEAGKFNIESVPFDLRGLLAAVHHAYRSLADGRALALTLRIADDVPAMVRGDPVRIRQILSNYITNALKFTEQGAVEIAASVPARGIVRLVVTDTGPGIAPEVQQRLFQPFTQADESTTRRYGGTGLGLSICKELALLMGGRCGVKSRPGTGSSFWVELPLPLAGKPGGEGTEPAPAETGLQGLSVLLVEDNPVNMMIAVALLEQWGLAVTQATDGQEAVWAVDAAAHDGCPFDAVLMDVQMPRLSGHEAAAELRKRYGSRQLPIIALTAAALVSEREQALAAGMDDFLTKPIDPPRLRQALLHVMSARQSA